jgi:hypothetical protein
MKTVWYCSSASAKKCADFILEVLVHYDSHIKKKKRFKLRYILESNPHPFYSFRGLKNQMGIRIACSLDSQSRAGFWKNDRTTVRAVRTIQ